MKKSASLLALAMLATNASAQYTPYPPATDEAAWPGRGVIRAFDFMHGIRQKHLASNADDDHAIVFVGDSLTENFKEIQARFAPLKVANRGLGGDTSRGVLFRFPLEVIPCKPQTVVICAGLNDLTAHGNPEDTLHNLREMIRLCHGYDRRMPVILCTLPMVSNPASHLWETEMPEEDVFEIDYVRVCQKK